MASAAAQAAPIECPSSTCRPLSCLPRPLEDAATPADAADPMTDAPAGPPVDSRTVSSSATSSSRPKLPLRSRLYASRSRGLAQGIHGVGSRKAAAATRFLPGKKRPCWLAYTAPARLAEHRNDLSLQPTVNGRAGLLPFLGSEKNWCGAH